MYSAVSKFLNLSELTKDIRFLRISISRDAIFYILQLIESLYRINFQLDEDDY